MFDRHTRFLVIALGIGTATVAACGGNNSTGDGPRAGSGGASGQSGAGGQAGTGGAGGTDAGTAIDSCPLKPATAATCTADCSWDEVAAKTAYCCTSGATTVFVMLVAECDGYHALLKRGYDTNELKYYDATSGALVASVYQGLPCTGQPIAAPAGCTLGPFHRLADWCGAYAADGRPNAHCCELPATNRLPTWEGVHAAICPASTQAGECGAYHALIDCRPYDGVFGPDETWYYDAASGALTAVVDTASGVPICIAGPADGFVPPTCAPAFAPFCDQAGDGGTAARCPLVPNAGGSCTEDCSWDAVAAKTSYCCPIKGAINTSEALVAECQGYKVLLKRGLDAGVVKYYDATTGALVASATTGASPCGSEPIATPPGCTLGAFAKLPQWCQTDAAEACADGGI